MLNNKYKDIINLPHHRSKKYPHMTQEERAAQFGAFAALTGYDEEIEETGRYTFKKIELNDEQTKKLNNKLQVIKKNIQARPKIECIYFIPDLYKEGGKYTTISGTVIKIDEYSKFIKLEGNIIIPFADIIELNY